ncbi:MAG: GspE/PulE family protein [Puniceicoccales bacterium]|jgi:type II secretory ATPase GspE/PulE/Tfp pilus assembly ATPase PilB-like protein|nr:GspE/PulE family protein [Puniceicoccales bacterium]
MRSSSFDGASGPIVDLLNEIIVQAIENRASDVHIESQEKNLRIRYRIDGKLSTFREFPKEISAPLLSRLKIVAQLPLDEHRRPLDGKWYYRHRGHENLSHDIRVSMIPFLHGEGAVLRILELLGVQSDLISLGFDRCDVRQSMENTIRESNGLFLVVGPTGCGKSTTIYTLLQLLNDGSRKIITVEDPVEYEVAGISQVNVAAEQKLSFADALRAILRQAPNVLFIGEIRDEETASIAVQAALTGHFVFTTLHADSAVGAISRLENLNISSQLLGSTLRGILAQRLLRKICQNCREECSISPLLREKFSLKDGEDHAFRGRGCEQCRQTGYVGRTAVYEWVEMATVKLRDGVPLREHIENRRMVTMSQCACDLILRGDISPEDILTIFC